MARTRKTKPPVDDPVTAYAKGVVAKTIIAGLLVRLACQRHLRDLEEQDARDIVWRPDQAQVAIDFFEQILCLPDEVKDGETELAVAEVDDDTAHAGGKPFLLTESQKFIVGSWFGWFRTDGPLRFRISYEETAKGSGKTPKAAGALLYRLLVRPGVGKQNYVAATMKEQARLTFTDAVNMVNASPYLKEKLEVTANAIAHLPSGSFIKPISAEKKGLDGKRVDGAVADEVHEHPKGVVVEKLRAGIKNRKDAQIFLTTNSGHDKTSVCWELHEYSRKVLEGVINDDSWFAYVCQLDPCEACYEAGKRVPQDECPHCDQWHTEGPHWLKVSPNLGITLPWEYVRDQVKQALGMPAQQNLVMRLNFCIWTEQHTIWIPNDKWAACKAPAILSFKNADRLPSTMGLDLSTTTDLTAGVTTVRHDDEVDKPADVVEIAVADEITGELVKKTLNLNYSVEVFPFFWMPEEKVKERVQKDRIPFDVWKKEGHLHTTPGPVVDYDVIYDHVVKKHEPTYRIQQIGYDPYNATQFAINLRDRARLTVVEVKQGKVLSEAAKLLFALVLSGRIRHPDNPVLNWCIANAMAEFDKYENISIVKPSPRQRIDGVIALLISLYLLSRLPVRRAKGRPPRVWTPQGFVPAVPPVGGSGGHGDRV